jgi:perosamine synthetase
MIGVGDFQATGLMIRDIIDTLVNGRLSYGDFSKKFEQEMATLHGHTYGVVSNSGTSSLQVALQAMKEVHQWPDDAEVLVPASTFVATVNIVLHNRMKPVLVDIEPDCFAMDPNLIQEKITSNTVAIIPVHPFGQPADMSRIWDIAYANKLRVIQDSCECIGATHHGKRIGLWGHIACFSTYVAHIVTSGVGGVATTGIGEYAEVMRSLVNHGRDNIYISPRTCDSRVEEVIGRRFKFDRVGHSFRITEMEAILAWHALQDLSENLQRRTANAEKLIIGLSGLINLRTMWRRPETDHSWMMFPIVVDEQVKPDLVQYLEQNGVETRDALPLIGQPCYNELFDEDDYPQARRLNRGGFYIGCHQYLTDAEIQYMIGLFAKFFKRGV